MDPSGGPNDLAEWAEQHLARVRRTQDDLSQVVGEGISERGYVTARTGPGGRLLDLRIEPALLRLPADIVAKELRFAVAAAQESFTKRTADLVAPVLGAGPTKARGVGTEPDFSRLDALADQLRNLGKTHRLD